MHKVHKVEDIVILEAKPRIGGRIFTVRDAGTTGESIELGAEYVHGEARNTFYKYANEQMLIAENKGQRGDEWYNIVSFYLLKHI